MEQCLYSMEGAGVIRPLLPLLTPSIHRSPIIGSLASRSKSGRLTRMERVWSCMPGSMLIGSHWTQGSLLISSFNYTMAQLYNGILYDVFTQKALIGWYPASTCRLVVSLLLPGSLEVEDWLLYSSEGSLSVAGFKFS